MARKAKYSEEWRHRAAALQTKIEEAMTLATSSCVEQRCRDGYPLHHPKTHGREADEDGRRSDRS
ncbi:hypothetical protein CRF11_19625 [Salmonella enterica subsp. enterica serovar Dublin]|nr:hypothetical protein [Salmonella enterica]EDL3343220.1 hypothetical protein [Salmonella enterica subsp. enterica serovar Dublin]